MERRFSDDMSKIVVGGLVWWLVSAVPGAFLLVSERVVGVRPYHGERVCVPWSGCDVRQWLNRDYLDGLPENVRSGLLRVDTFDCDVAVPQRAWDGDGRVVDAPVGDRVFLLSREEVGTYFSYEPWRSATDGTGERIRWWLRSPMFQDAIADAVDPYGRPYGEGGFVDDADTGVRPAIWVRANMVNQVCGLGRTA
jgi:hypothetical protein